MFGGSRKSLNTLSTPFGEIEVRTGDRSRNCSLQAGEMARGGFAERAAGARAAALKLNCSPKQWIFYRINSIWWRKLRNRDTLDKLVAQASEWE